METFSVWLGYALTLFILSFLYRDNPFYKLAEHAFVGISAGYYIALAWEENLVPNLVGPLADGNLWRIAPLILSVFMFSRFVPRVSWLSRWPIAFTVGMYAGINVVAYGRGDLVIQLQSTMLNVNFLQGGWAGVSNILLVAGLASSLLYFYFSAEHRGALGVVSRVGVWFLMISFGASFGYTVMSRVSLAIGRTRYLLEHEIVAAILIVVVGALLAVWARTRADEAEEAGP